MKHLERYTGTRRVIRKALRLMDERIATEYNIRILEAKKGNLINEHSCALSEMTGGDRARYDIIVGDLMKPGKDSD